MEKHDRHLAFIKSSARQAPARREKRPASFTLIELLVIVAIISILAGLLLPALNKARDKAKEIYCLNSIKQFGYAAQIYSDSFNGFAIPCVFDAASDYSWIDYMHNENGMNKKIFQCPSMTEEQCFNPYGGSDLPSSVSDASYTMNVIEKGKWNGAAISSNPDSSTGWGDNSNNPISLKNIPEPTNKIYIVDVLKKESGYGGWANAATHSSDATRIVSYLETDHGTLPVDAGTDRRDVGKHHADGFNALMGDLHGERIKTSSPDQWVVRF